MKRLLFAGILICAVASYVFALGEGGIQGGGSGSTNADDLSSGTVGAARGGTNIDTSASTGVPYVDNGTWGVDNQATFVQRFSGCEDNTDLLSGDGTCVAAGSGDMTKAVYDTGDDGQIDNAALADALGANGANCSAGQAPLGVDASGAVESCWTPATGTVTGPAAATQDNGACWGADNVTLKDCGYAPLAPDGSLASLTGDYGANVISAAKGGSGQDSSGWTGVPLVTAGTWAAKTYAQFLLPMGITYNPTDNSWTFAGTITFPEAVSTCVPADNNCGQTANNDGDPTGSDLSAGVQWFNTSEQCFKIRNPDNTANITMSCLTKTFGFGIDNVVAVSDNNIFIWNDLPRAITITKISCTASTDNVVGVLSECTAGDITSCTNVDDTDWTIGGETAAAVGTTYDSGFENPGIAAGAYLKWITTSVGTTNSNKLSCTVRYTE